MLDILFWISIFSGGLLLLMLLLSLIGGLDFDFDIGGDADVDLDNSAGLGILKGGLTFISIGSWVFRIFLIYNQAKSISLIAGISAGVISVYFLSKLFRILLNQQEDNSWSIDDTLNLEGKVYLKIPGEQKGNGIVQVLLNGTMKELKASTMLKNDIPTGSDVLIVEIMDQQVIVEKI